MKRRQYQIELFDTAEDKWAMSWHFFHAIFSLWPHKNSKKITNHDGFQNFWDKRIMGFEIKKIAFIFHSFCALAISIDEQYRKIKRQLLFNLTF